MEDSKSRSQVNMRISSGVAKLIDAKRIELSKERGSIPSRSDVLRFALGDYLGIDISAYEIDGRTLPRK